MKKSRFMEESSAAEPVSHQPRPPRREELRARGAHAVLLVTGDPAGTLPPFTAAMIARLKLQIEKLKRSERTARLLDQLGLQLEELETAATEDEIAADQATTLAGDTTPLRPFTRKKPSRKRAAARGSGWHHTDGEQPRMGASGQIPHVESRRVVDEDRQHQDRM